MSVEKDSETRILLIALFVLIGLIVFSISIFTALMELAKG